MKENDFLEVNYTGKLSDTQEVFDTTLPDVALKANLPVQGKLSPVIVQIGKQHLLPALEKRIIGKAMNDTIHAHLEPEEAFGRRNSGLVKLLPLRKFKEQKITPVPHLQVNIDGRTGIIRSVTGGRILVDMNHPLAGKAVDYEVQLLRQVTDPKEQADALLKMIGMPVANTELKEKTLQVTLKQALPEQFQQQLKKEILNAVSSLQDIVFMAEENTAQEKTGSETAQQQ